MRAKSRTVRRDARPYGRKGDTGGDATDRITAAAPSDDDVGVEKSDRARRAILDAALACFAELGWSGTNMSVIARRSRMTRGRIQYYFPTLDDLQRAAIAHLTVEWRRNYFSSIAKPDGPSARFETGIDVLWRLVQDPLHIAKQELEANARTNPELRALMQEAAIEDEEASIPAAKLAYPELAERGEAALTLARSFTMVFMEGLTLFRFAQDAEVRRAELIQMLKTVLVSYWSSLGVEGLAQTPPPAQTPTPQRRDLERERALALIQEAAALLSAAPHTP